ncbi:MAG: hypothetical protein K6G27_10590 [Lachnospiraceae bacterium]|nr:hypothetical protein [Lachnospiraceae bacterium]
MDKAMFSNAFTGASPDKELIDELFDNQSILADQIEYVTPLREGRFLPEYPNADEELAEICREKAREIYGNELPQAVEKRLEIELNAIQKNGYSSIFMMTRSVAIKSLEAGYHVGSRGAAASSLVAFLCGITEINPMPQEFGG